MSEWNKETQLLNNLTTLRLQSKLKFVPLPKPFPAFMGPSSSTEFNRAPISIPSSFPHNICLRFAPNLFSVPALVLYVVSSFITAPSLLAQLVNVLAYDRTLARSSHKPSWYHRFCSNYSEQQASLNLDLLLNIANGHIVQHMKEEAVSSCEISI